jgi:hypothetical protein
MQQQPNTYGVVPVGDDHWIQRPFPQVVEDALLFVGWGRQNLYVKKFTLFVNRRRSAHIPNDPSDVSYQQELQFAFNWAMQQVGLARSRGRIRLFLRECDTKVQGLLEKMCPRQDGGKYSDQLSTWMKTLSQRLTLIQDDDDHFLAMLGRAEAEAAEVDPRAQLKASFGHAQKLQRLSQELTQIEAEWNNPEEYGHPVKFLACGAAIQIRLTSEGRSACSRRIAMAWAGSLNGVADNTSVVVDDNVHDPDLCYTVTEDGKQLPFKLAFSRLGLYLPVSWHFRAKQIDELCQFQRSQTPSKKESSTANRSQAQAQPVTEHQHQHYNSNMTPDKGARTPSMLL